MKNTDLAEHQMDPRWVQASEELNRLFSIYPRVDAKASVLLGVATAMLGVLVTYIPDNVGRTELFSTVPPAALLVLCLIYVYLGSFPRLDAKEDSMVYFGAVSKATEKRWKEAWHEMSRDEHLEEVLSQCWHNSCILDRKFACLKLAHLLLAWAIPFWVMALGLLNLATK